jgi:Dolichyl-phosphate-mannose-protein mannosyltransferase/Alg9-like mannosyltransferase family
LHSKTSLSIDKKFWLILFVPLIYYVIFLISGNPILPDGVQYSDLGWSLFAKGNYSSSYGVVPGWIQPPLFPICIGIFSLVFPIEIAGHLVGTSCATLILVFLYKFTKSEFNQQSAILTVLILSINPLFLLGNVGIIAETLYTLINLLLFIYMYKNTKNKAGFRYIEVFFIGLLFAALYATRSEAILYLPIILFVLIKYSNYKKALLFLSMATVLFCSFGFYSMQKMDEFKIAPKLTYSSRIGLLVAKYYADKGNQTSIDEKNIFSWYGYDSTANALYSENIMNQKYFQNLENKFPVEIPMSKAMVAMAVRIVYNLYDVLKIIIISPFMPVSLLLIVLLGIWTFYQDNRKFILFCALWLLPTFYFMVSHVEVRFFYVLLPLVSIFAAVGLLSILKKAKYPGIILTIVFIILILDNYSQYHEFYENRQHSFKYREVADELIQKGFSKEKICSRNFYAAFFSGCAFLKLPICNAAQLTRYMAANNSRILILDSEVDDSHSGLMDIYQNKKDQFALINEIDFNKKKIKIFRLTGNENSKLKE